MADKEIVLNAETFKALAGEKRVQILKELGQRRKTQSELAQKLGLSPPTVSEHLDLLSKAGLVYPIDEGRKWKYFALTQKGKELLNPGETRILVLLGTSFVLFLGSLAFVWYRFMGLGGFSGAQANTLSGDTMASKAIQDSAIQANQETIQATVSTAIQTAIEQTKAPAAAPATASNEAGTQMVQTALDANAQATQETVNQISNQATQEILSNLQVPSSEPVTITKITSVIAGHELVIVLAIALFFGLVAGYYWHQHQSYHK